MRAEVVAVVDDAPHQGVMIGVREEVAGHEEGGFGFVPGEFGEDGVAAFGELVSGEDQGYGFGGFWAADDAAVVAIEGLRARLVREGP